VYIINLLHTTQGCVYNIILTFYSAAYIRQWIITESSGPVWVILDALDTCGSDRVQSFRLASVYGRAQNSRAWSRLLSWEWPRLMHWRRQLWGTGKRSPSTYSNLFFSVHFDMYKVWQRLYVNSCLL